MMWSVGIEAEAGRVLTREQVVELADAVAEFDGIATGIGTSRYGAQLIVEAASREAAIEAATVNFRRAAATAGLPEGPIVRTEAISEAEDEAAFETAGGFEPAAHPAFEAAAGFEPDAGPAFETAADPEPSGQADSP